MGPAYLVPRVLGGRHYIVDTPVLLWKDTESVSSGDDTAVWKD